MEPSIHKIVSMGKIGKSNHHYSIMFVERFDKMLAGLFDQFTVLYKHTVIYQGIEDVSIMLPDDQISELKQGLLALGDVHSFIQKNVNEENYLKFYFSLSKRELLILRTAYNNGYYELPRRAYLRDIARLTNLSKSTVEDYLRIAERKILSSEQYLHLV